MKKKRVAKTECNGLTRRQFVKTGMSAGLAAATMSCSTLGGRRPAGDDVEYDYIVVGSGAGGGPVAANLAQHFKVLLIEAGDNYKSTNEDIPALHPSSTEDPGMCWNFFVDHYSDPSKQRADSKYVNGRGILYPRAGTLGGCTAHNAMITLYNHNSDWDEIADMTKDNSWTSDKMRQYWERVENFTDPLFLYHRTKGWLSVEQNNPQFLIEEEKFRRIIGASIGGMLTPETALLFFGSKIKMDPNGADFVNANEDAVVNVPKATKNGHRNGTRELILNTMNKYPDNLFLSTNSLATRVLFQEGSNRAIGVEFIPAPHVYRADPNPDAEGAKQAPQRRFAKREVILCGGAFNSPQLLMLSGIGPRADLEKLGINVLVDLPGVGKNLQDRYEVGVVSKLNSEFDVLNYCTFGAADDPCVKEFERDPFRSIYSSNGPIIGHVRRSQARKNNPDLMIFGLPSRFAGYKPGYSREAAVRNYLTWGVLKGHTRNTAGTVSLRSSDPLDTPLINFRYFDEGNDPSGDDLDSVVKGIMMARDLNNHRFMKPIIAKEELPAKSPAELKQWVKNEAWGHHASCTNKIGADSDALAVLDSKFRVRGTRGLRVVDASVFPKIPGLFIVVPIYMIAEKASDDIIADAGKI